MKNKEWNHLQKEPGQQASRRHGRHLQEVMIRSRCICIDKAPLLLQCLHITSLLLPLQEVCVVSDSQGMKEIPLLPEEAMPQVSSQVMMHWNTSVFSQQWRLQPPCLPRSHVQKLSTLFTQNIGARKDLSKNGYRSYIYVCMYVCTYLCIYVSM